MNIKKKAVSLIEVLIGVILSSILLVGVMNLLTSGLKDSAKSLTHQDNMETANILMSQIEYDLSRATEIINPDWNDEGNGALWVFDSNSVDSGRMIFSYDYADPQKGVHRHVEGNKIFDNYFAKGHFVELKFKHFSVDAGKGVKEDFIIEKHGMWVDLTVYSKDITEANKEKDKEAFTMRRLIVVRRPF